MGAGLAMVIVESTWSFFGLKHKLETRLLAKIAKIIPIILSLYAIGRFTELFISGDNIYLFTGDKYSLLFWVEMLIFVLIPVVLFSLPSVRRKPMQMFATALLVVFGLLLNRFNVSLVAFSAGAYAPTWIEIFVTIGMVSIGAFVFTLASRYLAVFPHMADEKTKVPTEEKKKIGDQEPVYSPATYTSKQAIEGKTSTSVPVSRLE
jgi:Ni/Fe-hydrogenase subunit HybB-like protein